jgi:hypothetical protein
LSLARLLAAKQILDLNLGGGHIWDHFAEESALRSMQKYAKNKNKQNICLSDVFLFVLSLESLICMYYYASCAQEIWAE